MSEHEHRIRIIEERRDEINVDALALALLDLLPLLDQATRDGLSKAGESIQRRLDAEGYPRDGENPTEASA